MKRGKKIWALLAAGAALVGCMGLSGTADAASLPKAQASSSQEKARASLQWKALKAEEKKILAQRREEEEKKKLLSSKKEEEERLQEERKEARGLEKKGKRQANLLETSPSGETTQNASVIGGGEWSGGVANPDTASVSSSPSPSIPSSNSITLQVSSPLYWVPFYFEGGSLPATSSGSLDEAEVKNWVLSGNFASGAYIGLQDTSVLQAGPFVQGAGAGSVSKANGGPGFQFPFFGGVDPETGKLVSGGITTAPASYFVVSSSPGSQTFEAYAVSSCIDNSSLPSIGETADSLLGVSSPSPSSCLAAFQKNAEAKAEIGGASYDLLSYQGLSSLLGILDYNIPSNPATGYQGPGYQGPVTVTVGLSPALMQLINAYNAWWGPNFSYELDVFDPDSPQEGYVSGEGAKWVFNPSLYTAHFKAVSEDGEPLKKVCVSIQTDFNYEDNLNFNDEPGVSDPEWWSWNLYLVPGYWDPENINSSTLNNYYNNYASAYDSLGVPPSSPPYKQFGWINSTNTYGDFSWEGVTFILNCVPGEPGEFELPKLPTGTYFVYLFEWGSAYAEDGDLTLSLSLGGSGGETIAAQDDPDGCVNSSTQTVVMETHNPFAEVLNSKGGAEESQSIPLEYGKGHTFTYQLQTYLPYSAPFSVSFNPGSSYGIDLNDAKVAGLPISDLESHGLTLNGDTVTLNSAALSYIEQNGYMPATYSSPAGTEKLSSQGWGARIFSIEIPTYLTSSFASGDTVSYTISYSNSVSGQSGQDIKGSLDDEDSNNGWFKAVSEDGEPLKNLTIQYQEISPFDPSYPDGKLEPLRNMETLRLSSSPTDPGLFVFPPELLPCQYSASVYIPEGSYYYAPPAYPQELFKFIPNSPGSGIGFSSMDYVPFVDSSTQTVVANVPNPSSQLLTSSGTVDASPYPTETVGKNFPFTYQTQVFFSTFPAEDTFSFEGNNPYTQQIMVGEPAGETVIQDPADITVAGIPLSTLDTKGASVSFNVGGESCPDDGYGSCFAAIVLNLPLSTLSYIASHGYKPATASNSVRQVPMGGESFGQLPVTFKAYLNSSQKTPEPPSSWEGYEACEPDDTLVNLYLGTFSSPQVFTNGPADNSVPSSLSMSSPSSETGLWWESLWKGKGTPAEGAKFTVQNQTEANGVKSPYYGEYLAPVEDDGTFEGWSWQASPYDFENNSSSAYFSMGGLADGAYKVTEASPATSPYKGVLPSPAPSFTANLTYSPSSSSFEALSPVSNPSGLLSSLKREGIVYSALPAAPITSLPLTGGEGKALPIALASLFSSLLAAGAFLAFRLRRKRP